MLPVLPFIIGGALGAVAGVALNPDYAIGKFQSKQTYYKI